MILNDFTRKRFLPSKINCISKVSKNFFQPLQFPRFKLILLISTYYPSTSFDHSIKKSKGILHFIFIPSMLIPMFVNIIFSKKERKGETYKKKNIRVRYEYITDKIANYYTRNKYIAVLLRIKIYRFLGNDIRGRNIFLFIYSPLLRIVERIYPRRESATKQIWICGDRYTITISFAKISSLANSKPPIQRLLRSN